MASRSSRRWASAAAGRVARHAGAGVRSGGILPSGDGGRLGRGLARGEGHGGREEAESGESRGGVQVCCLRSDHAGASRPMRAGARGNARRRAAGAAAPITAPSTSSIARTQRLLQPRFRVARLRPGGRQGGELTQHLVLHACERSGARTPSSSSCSRASSASSGDACRARALQLRDGSGAPVCRGARSRRRLGTSNSARTGASVHHERARRVLLEVCDHVAAPERRQQRGHRGAHRAHATDAAQTAPGDHEHLGGARPPAAAAATARTRAVASAAVGCCARRLSVRRGPNRSSSNACSIGRAERGVSGMSCGRCVARTLTAGAVRRRWGPPRADGQRVAELAVPDRSSPCSASRSTRPSIGCVGVRPNAAASVAARSTVRAGAS